MFGAQKIQSSYDVTLLYMRGRCDRLNIGRPTTTNSLGIGSPSSTLPRPPGSLRPPNGLDFSSSTLDRGSGSQTYLSFFLELLGVCPRRPLSRRRLRLLGPRQWLPVPCGGCPRRPLSRRRLRLLGPRVAPAGLCLVTPIWTCSICAKRIFLCFLWVDLL